MRTLATLQQPDSGSVRLGATDVLRSQDEVRRQLGYLPQEFGVYPRISAQDMLNHLAILKGVADSQERKSTVERLLRQTNLLDVRKRRLGTFSGGMKQRFGIAQALIGNPRLVIVDEPTAGLDPEERLRFLNLLSAIGENVVVILSTHIVEDVADLCQRMAIISEGELLLTGRPKSAIADLAGCVWEKEIDPADLDSEKSRRRVISTHLSGGRTVVRVESSDNPGDDYEAAEPELKDVYFSVLNGRELARAA
jgi:ABC-type multidrug transport system ATPase subunit